MSKYQELIDDAKKARELGDEDLELQLLQMADKEGGAESKPAENPDDYGVFAGHDFGPRDSVILSSLANPQKVPEKFSSWLRGKMGIAAGEVSPYDNPNPLTSITTPREQIEAGMALAGLAQTGALPMAPASRGGILGTILAPFSRKLGAIAKIKRELGAPLAASEPPIMPIGAGRGSVPSDGVGPIRPPFAMIEGIKPTAAMLYDDPRVLQLEINARNAPASQGAGKGFYERDMQNLAALYNANAARAMSDKEASTLQDLLNLRAGETRQNAFDAIRAKALEEEPPLPSYAQPLNELLGRMETTPGQRNVPSTEKLVALGRKMLSPTDTANLDPEDLYALRKVLSDTLSSKGQAFDELTNAARSSRREAVALKNAIDEGLNASSDGEFSRYLGEYRSGMQPINEGRAFQNILDRFENKSRIHGTDIPIMTPYAYRKAVDDLTYTNLGKAGWEDKLSGTGRELTNDSSAALSALETAMKGPKATIGSDTAAWTAGLLKRGLIPGGGKLGAFIDLMDALAQSKGMAELDEALLNPQSGRLEELFRLYGDRAAPISPLSQMIRRGFMRGGLAELLGRQGASSSSEKK